MMRAIVMRMAIYPAPFPKTPQRALGMRDQNNLSAGFSTPTERCGIYLLIAVPLLALFFPVLFAHEIFADADVVLQQYTSMQFLKDALSSGDSLQWNPHVLTGSIPTAGLMGGLLSWLNQAVFSIFPVFDGFAWLTFFYVWLSGIFTFELASRLGLSRKTAVFAGLVLPLFTAYFTWAQNMTIAPGNALLPMLFFFLLAISRRLARLKSIFIALAGGAAVGTVMLAAHFQWTLQAMFLAGIWALFLAFKNRRFGILIYAVILAAAAAAVFWPQFEVSLYAKEFSARAEPLTFTEAQAGALLPGDILSVIFPNLSLPAAVSEPGLFYLGAPVLLFLILSVFGPKNQEYKFFALTGLLLILASVKYSPLLWLMHKLPLFSSFRAISRLSYAALFFLVLLAAYGFEKVLKNEIGLAKPAKRLLAGSILIAALFAAGSVLFPKIENIVQNKAGQYLQARFDAGNLTLPQSHYQAVIDNEIEKIRQGATIPNLPITVSIASLIFGALIIVMRPRLQDKHFTLLALSAAALNLLVVNFSLSATVSARQLETAPPPLAFLQRDKIDFRVLTLFSGFSAFEKLDSKHGYDPVDNVEFMKNILAPNLAAYYGADGLDYYDNIIDRRSSRLLSYLGSDRSQETQDVLVNEKIALPEKIRKFTQRLPVLSRYNVKYIISAYPLADARLKRVFRWPATRHDIPIEAYENLSVEPRYYLTSNALFSKPLSEKESWEKNLQAISQKETLIECNECPVVKSGLGRITPISRRNNYFEFEVNTETDQMFVFGQNFLKKGGQGWKAEIDGQKAEIYRANYLNQAVFVPKGAHKIIFGFSL